MITTILGISILTMVISGLFFLFTCLYDMLTDNSCDTIELVCALICCVAMLNCAICRLAFIDKLDAEKLESVKELVNPLQSSNALVPIDFTELGIVKGPVKPLHPSKAFSPIDVTEVGITNLPVNPLQY